MIKIRLFMAKVLLKFVIKIEHCSDPKIISNNDIMIKLFVKIKLRNEYTLMWLHMACCQVTSQVNL